MSIFNRRAWQDFNASIDHTHMFDSWHGFLSIRGIAGRVTLLRCKCGHGQWFFQ